MSRAQAIYNISGTCGEARQVNFMEALTEQGMLSALAPSHKKARFQVLELGRKAVVSASVTNTHSVQHGIPGL